ncbi:MAG: hypothetical protein K5851_02300 [Lachnospiraceae bacterium]|nr:hypothetical protein [Lachnospiraceae bacterium]
MGMRKSYENRSEILNDLQEAFLGKDDHKLLDGNEDGRFIASRIAFEAYTPEEMEKVSRMRRRAKERVDRLKKEQAVRKQELEMFKIAYELRKVGGVDGKVNGKK